MGKKLNALLGRNSKAAKLRIVSHLASSRIAILRNLHSVKCSQARSDVIQLLERGDQERALLRVEYVIKEQNMLDALVMIENYCHLLGERSEIIKKSSRECPDELKEAISSLIFAASRCGGFPELQEIRSMITSEYGKEFAGCAVELRKNCSVCPKMIHRLTSKQASSETRQNLLKQMAIDNGITLQLQHEEFDVSKMHASNETYKAHTIHKTSLENRLPEEAIGDESLSESEKANMAYKDVDDEAQDASTRAVELCRVKPFDTYHLNT